MVEAKRPGLSSLNESRANRYRQITSGKSTVGAIPPKLFLAGLLFLVLGGIAYYRHQAGLLEKQRAALLAKQRAVAQTMGPRLLPMQAAVEKGLAALAKPSAKDEVTAGVDFAKLFGQPGLYLRMRTAESSDPKLVRAAAGRQVRDGFTSCLMRDLRAAPPTVGSACKESIECQPGELCSEYGVCQRPHSPFNMRLLYRAVAVLSEEWLSEVKNAGADLALVAYERGLDSVTRVDIPVAIDVYQRAKYFVLVLDDDPAAGLPKAIPNTDETPEERIERVAHPARVGIWELPSGKLLARVSGEASGQLRDVGPQRIAQDEASQAGRTRQANSCGLALEVLGKLKPAGDSSDIVAGPSPPAIPNGN
ncbi:MAG TPA: hypothetical protein VLC09_16485 [Polyangiaceae bacterium]|nr:hypothetical protein [Polyangiaceae bacterium]